MDWLTEKEDEIREVINGLGLEAHTTAVEKGWYESEISFPARVALMHSELSEALEAHRKSYGSEVIAEELADVIIRILDECAADNLDLSAALLAKMKKNRTRSRRHGNLPY